MVRLNLSPQRLCHGPPWLATLGACCDPSGCQDARASTIKPLPNPMSCATQRAIVRWLNTAGSGWGLRESNRSRYWVPTDAVERRREVGLRRRDAFSEPLGRRSSKFEKASACVSEHSGKLWSSPFHRMPCICACRTCPFRNIARTKRHVAPSRTWDMSCLPSPRCSLPPLLAFRNLYYRSGNPKHVS